MSQKLVIYFTANGHALYRWAGGALELESRFTPDDAGLEDFRGHLRGRRGALVYVLADLAGEDFHEDQIPYLRGNDRQAVVDRRLAQRYRDTRLAAALPLGMGSGERRNERLLLASFTNTQQFTAWLDVLSESGARLSGVYSVPLLAPALAARLGVRSGRAFVLTATARACGSASWKTAGCASRAWSALPTWRRKRCRRSCAPRPCGWCNSSRRCVRCRARVRRCR